MYFFEEYYKYTNITKYYKYFGIIKFDLIFELFLQKKKNVASTCDLIFANKTVALAFNSALT